MQDTIASDPLITLAGARMVPLTSGALWWPERRVLTVADLHFGRAERMAREGGGLLPPYETEDTLARLEEAVQRLNPRIVISLGDSFDDLTAAARLQDSVIDRLARLAAGRRLIWIAGNHDPGPVELPGTHLEEAEIGGVAFRHITATAQVPEISAHFHPKVRITRRGRRLTRRCFLASGQRLILPAFGTYTGGLDVRDPAFADLIAPGAQLYLMDRRIVALPFDRLS